VHPHDYIGNVPETLPPQKVRELSQLDPARSLFAVVEEWLGIAAAIFLCERLGSPWLYPLAVLFIGARQHALLIIGHDAVHYRLLRRRRLNDWVANLLLWWPMCITTNELFRRDHSAHHRYLGTDKDGNIALWRLRDADGQPTREWTYPKTSWQLAAKLLWRGCGLTGLAMLLGGLIRPLWAVGLGYGLLRLATLATVFGLVTAAGHLDLLVLYWLVPLCTWFIASNYIRLICEHTEVRSARPLYTLTRTTIPTWFDRVFIIPRNVGYHCEHHIYPSVPFYRLPALHEAMMGLASFRDDAHITRGIGRALRECVTPRSSG